MQADGHDVGNLFESVTPKVTSKLPTNEGPACQIAYFIGPFPESAELRQYARQPQPGCTDESRTAAIASICRTDRCRQHLTANCRWLVRGGREIRRGQRAPNLR